MDGTLIKVSRIFVDDLDTSFANRDRVRVDNPDPPLDQATLQANCTKALFDL